MPWINGVTFIGMKNKIESQDYAIKSLMERITNLEKKIADGSRFSHMLLEKLGLKAVPPTAGHWEIKKKGNK